MGQASIEGGSRKRPRRITYLQDMKKAGVDVYLMKGEEIKKAWAESEVRVRDLLIRLKLVEK